MNRNIRVNSFDNSFRYKDLDFCLANRKVTDEKSGQISVSGNQGKILALVLLKVAHQAEQARREVR